jgi:hypothetical protein
MAEEHATGGDEEIFVYMGGEQEVPMGVKHVRVDKSVTAIPRRAFYRRRNLEYVLLHDSVDRVEERSFKECTSLRGLNMPGVREIDLSALYGCTALTDVRMPAIERIGQLAFYKCPLRRITMPLKDDLMMEDGFFRCPNLATVDIADRVQIRNTISSLHMEVWRNEMKAEIDRINLVLPTIPSEQKTEAIQQWIKSAYHMMAFYRDQHEALLGEILPLILNLGLPREVISENVMPFLSLTD